MKSTYFTIYLIAVILLLSACGNQTIRPDKQQYTGLDQANIYYFNKDYVNAAQAFERLYQQYQKNEFGLKAADSWLQLQQYQKAQSQLSLINYNNSPLYLLIRAELQIKNGNYPNHLNNINGEFRPRFLKLNALVLANKQEYLNAARALIELSTLDSEAIVNDDIVDHLIHSTEQEISDALFDFDTSELEQGWLEAAYIAYSQNSDAKIQWQNRWGDHPAKLFFIQAQDYKNIAVLLPLSGKYKLISQSIQQGMIAALYNNNSGAKLNFFDTGSNGENFSYAWYGAIESGADFVIGPLEKKSIQQLSNLNSSTVPVMLLNQLDDISQNSDFYQFALTQEDEARNVANRLVAENKKRIMLLAPETAKGRKLAIEFEADYNFQGGQVVSYYFYNKNTHDYKTEIRQALGINESNLRAGQLQSLLSQKISSVAQARPDIDAIFLIAEPQIARAIKPQLKFNSAGHLPVYATSAIYSDRGNSDLNKDLNDINFCQSAFVINPSAFSSLLNIDVNRLNVLDKYFAFGYDAVSLSSRLEWMKRVQNNKIEGLSGYLSVDSSGILHRDLAWAQIRNGEPVLLPELKVEENLPIINIESD